MDLLPSTELSSWRRVRKWNLCDTVSRSCHSNVFLTTALHCRFAQPTMFEDRRADGVSAYLCIDRKTRIPAIGWYYLRNPVLCGFQTNFSHVGHRILEIFLGRPEGRRFLQAVRSNPLRRFSHSQRVSSPLHGGQVQSGSPPHTERYMRSVHRIGAVAGIDGMRRLGLRCSGCWRWAYIIVNGGGASGSGSCYHREGLYRQVERRRNPMGSIVGRSHTGSEGQMRCCTMQVLCDARQLELVGYFICLTRSDQSTEKRTLPRRSGGLVMKVIHIEIPNESEGLIVSTA